MLTTLSPLRAALTFYAMAVALVTLVALTGGSTSVAMLTPLVSMLLMLLLVTREGWSRNGWPPSACTGSACAAGPSRSLYPP